ncbi:hypothetical protein FTUN_3332 [Frigoriglobus tundricola]|uniref:Uncharacterized protein n=1 Tax=Frigoriglobus tundricola TaxID=2774151 RepID=A0A6M5YP71_9BACT|nr:hypothetical protein FTUN_3332 [Frigoriglobus tundricola]
MRFRDSARRRDFRGGHGDESEREESLYGVIKKFFPPQVAVAVLCG